MKPWMIALLAVSLSGLPAMIAGAAEPGATGVQGPAPRSGAGERDQVQGGTGNDMQEMQRLMDRLQRTRDPAERRELIREHHEALQQTLVSIRNMRWQGGDCPQNEGNACLAQRQRMLEQRLDMMEQVLEQLVQQQSIVIERTRR